MIEAHFLGNQQRMDKQALWHILQVATKFLEIHKKSVYQGGKERMVESRNLLRDRHIPRI